MRALIALMAVLPLVLAAGLLQGCGKKAWPEPITAEDRFTFSNPRTVLAGGCLTVQADLKGATENLSEVILEIASADCPDCPMTPERIVRLSNRAEFMDSEKSILIRACDLPRDTPLRWRLRGVNVISGMAHEGLPARVVTPEPPKTE